MSLLGKFRDWRRRTRARRREARYQRLLDRLGEIEVAADPGPPGLAITVVLTSQPDPQRAAPQLGDPARYIRPWWNSINRGGLRGVILHDGLPDAFVTEAATACVRFARIGVGGWPLLHERHRIVRNFLKTIDDELILVTDASDVVFRRNPFALIAAENDRHRLFVGSEGMLMRDNPYMAQDMQTQYGEMRHADRMVMNPGIIGGRRAAVSELLDQVIAEIARNVTRLRPSDMCIFNHVIHTFYPPQEIVTGHPLHSRFKAWEFKTDAAIIHK